ncbi:hypothetical protein E2C01_101414 [Portunus trituberculatus]|uniref:Uncharacterized protein n=1 Tax=Portunus trituberculatus TaxID=210409 RepID=A0A5B7KG19_PORTR|nr:hypothetical protein [Portunus trituberculatus]
MRKALQPRRSPRPGRVPLLPPCEASLRSLRPHDFLTPFKYSPPPCQGCRGRPACSEGGGSDEGINDARCINIHLTTGTLVQIPMTAFPSVSSFYLDRIEHATVMEVVTASKDVFRVPRIV